MASYLGFIINLSFMIALFPKERSKANAFHLKKEGSKIDENNYRPISLLIVSSKVYERAIYNRFYFYLEKFSLRFQNNMA